MKIGDSNPTSLPPGTIGGPGLEKSQQAEQLRRSGGSGGTDAALGKSPDQVALSDLGGRLRGLSLDSPERTARMEKLSAEVQAGRYQVDAKELSHRLISEAMNPFQ